LPQKKKSSCVFSQRSLVLCTYIFIVYIDPFGILPSVCLTRCRFDFTLLQVDVIIIKCHNYHNWAVHCWGSTLLLCVCMFWVFPSVPSLCLFVLTYRDARLEKDTRPTRVYSDKGKLALCLNSCVQTSDGSFFIHHIEEPLCLGPV
jgi:hypothetical protein